MAGQVRVESWTAGKDAAGAQAVRVVLAHPGKRNAMSRAMWRQLRSVFEELQLRPGLRCIVLQGEGEAFCAGGDISEYADFRFHPESLAAFHEGEVWPALHAMLQCDVPLVAAIEGACMGAGVELASCCDSRLAADTAQFGAPIAKLGFPMAPREAALVLSEVGPAKTRQMLLEAAVFGADQMPPGRPAAGRAGAHGGPHLWPGPPGRPHDQATAACAGRRRCPGPGAAAALCLCRFCRAPRRHCRLCSQEKSPVLTLPARASGPAAGAKETTNHVDQHDQRQPVLRAARSLS
jgi:Enoyl-CoA hydratase/isomerase